MKPLLCDICDFHICKRAIYISLYKNYSLFWNKSIFFFSVLVIFFKTHTHIWLFIIYSILLKYLFFLNFLIISLLLYTIVDVYSLPLLLRNVKNSNKNCFEYNLKCLLNLDKHCCRILFCTTGSWSYTSNFWTYANSLKLEAFSGYCFGPFD